MMGPSEDLQRLLIRTLEADPAVSALVPGRVIDEKRGKVAYPYIRIGPADVDPRDGDDLVASEHIRQIDVYSRDGGKLVCGRICDAVKAALHEQPLELTDNALSVITATYRVIGEPDGITQHGVVTVTAFVEEPQP